MFSSIFNFRPFAFGGFASAITTAVGVFFPTLVAAVFFLGIGEAWYRLDPQTRPAPDGFETFESSLMQTQMFREAAAPRADVLIVGDSSALMGADGLDLERRLAGRHVESLATMGFVGPAGYGAMAERYLRRVGEVEVLVILINWRTIADDEANYTTYGYEQMALTGRLEYEKLGPGSAARQKLFADLVARLVPVPLRGAYGREYGFTEGIEAFLMNNRGTMIDPNKSLKGAALGSQPFTVKIEEPFSARLRGLADSLSRVNARHVYFGFTPRRASEYGEESHRDRENALRTIRSRIGLDPAVGLNLPDLFPDELFVSAYHLSRFGRAAFTERLADALLAAVPTLENGARQAGAEGTARPSNR